jgi:hypothetical protein
MKSNPPAAPANPVFLFIAAGWLAAEALAALLIALAALVLSLSGGRPAPPPVIAPAPAPPSSRLEPDVSAMGTASSA